MKLVAILRIKNAISTVEECLGRLSSLVDEIIVLDNGSTDGTSEVYKKFSKIKEILHTEGFHEGRDKIMLLDAAKARNPDWILWLDADEIFERNMTREVLDGYMRSGHPIYGFRMYNFWLNRKVWRFDNRWFRYTLNIQRHMWKNLPGTYFANKRFHNGPIAGIPERVKVSPYRLKHYGYADKDELTRKWKFYSANEKTRDYSHLNPESRTLVLPFLEFKNPKLNFLYIVAHSFLANVFLNILRVTDAVKKPFSSKKTLNQTNFAEQPNVAIIVSSYDASSDIWKAFFTLFFRYWPDCPYPVHLITNYLKFDDDRVKTIAVGPDKKWASNLKSALKSIDSPYVIYLQEDYFLQKQADTKCIQDLVRHAQSVNAAYVRISPSPKPDEKYSGFPGVGKISAKAPHRTSLQGAIWDKKYLDSLLVEGESGWDMEFRGTERSRGDYRLFLAAKKPPLYYFPTTAIKKGRWYYDAVRLCRREGIELDLNKRAVESKSEFYKRKFRYLIRPAKQAVRKLFL